MKVTVQKSVKAANRTQKRAFRTRTRLLEAALSLFAEKGYDATSIQDITDRADLGKGTFYRHFATKEEIMLVLTADAVARMSEKIHEGTEAAASLEDVTSKLLEVHRVFFSENYNEFILLFQGRMYLKFQREDSSPLEEPFMSYLKALEVAIIPFAPEGVNPYKVRRLACALAGFVSGFLSFAMIGLNESDLDHSIAPLRQVFVSTAAEFLKVSNPPEGTGKTAIRQA